MILCTFRSKLSSSVVDANDIVINVYNQRIDISKSSYHAYYCYDISDQHIKFIMFNINNNTNTINNNNNQAINNLSQSFELGDINTIKSMQATNKRVKNYCGSIAIERFETKKLVKNNVTNEILLCDSDHSKTKIQFMPQNVLLFEDFEEKPVFVTNSDKDTKIFISKLVTRLNKLKIMGLDVVEKEYQNMTKIQKHKEYSDTLDEMQVGELHESEHLLTVKVY